MEGSVSWRGAIAGGGELCQVKGIGFRWRGAVSGESQVEGSGLRCRGAIAGGGDGLQIYTFFSTLKRSATDTAAMESFDAKSCSDHLCCCI